MARKISVDVWSDIVCPWCAIGDRRLSTALASFAHAPDVRVTWHAFELDPSAPPVRSDDHVEHLARKYGRSPAQAREMIQRVIDVAAQDGLDLRLFQARAGNTFDGHRVLRLAAERGVHDAVKERLFRGYMTEGHAIGDRAVLARLAGEAGLDAAEVTDVLAGDLYAAEVRGDEETARELGITGVPFFVFDGRLAVSGAQPAEVLRQALDRAWASAADEGASEPGAACGPDGCA
jgi:predicted DsbA family dithiol-disulfide isomerase